MRRKIGLIVDDIEGVGALEEMREMAIFPDLGVDRRVVAVGRRYDRFEFCGGKAVRGRKEGDVDAAGD